MLEELNLMHCDPEPWIMPLEVPLFVEIYLISLHVHLQLSVVSVSEQIERSKSELYLVVLWEGVSEINELEP